jgi:hypothetical protein
MEFPEVLPPPRSGAHEKVTGADTKVTYLAVTYCAAPTLSPKVKAASDGTERNLQAGKERQLDWLCLKCNINNVNNL